MNEKTSMIKSRGVLFSFLFVLPLFGNSFEVVKETAFQKMLSESNENRKKIYAEAESRAKQCEISMTEAKRLANIKYTAALREQLSRMIRSYDDFQRRLVGQVNARGLLTEIKNMSQNAVDRLAPEIANYHNFEYIYNDYEKDVSDVSGLMRRKFFAIWNQLGPVDTAIQKMIQEHRASTRTSTRILGTLFGSYVVSRNQKIIQDIRSVDQAAILALSGQIDKIDGKRQQVYSINNLCDWGNVIMKNESQIEHNAGNSFKNTPDFAFLERHCFANNLPFYYPQGETNLENPGEEWHPSCR